MKQRISLLIASVLLWTSCLFSQTAVKPPGSGTDADPYLVSTLENLHYIHLHPGGDCFVQIADIDASASRLWDGGKGFIPIGSVEQTFNGLYNGNGFVIRGLYINRPATDYIGLFGFIGHGMVQNIGLTDVHITGKNNVGGIAGSTDGSNTLSGCFVTGEVNGVSIVGGLVGSNIQTTINNCYTTCSVSGTYFDAGGLVGDNIYSLVSDCYATGNVNGSHTVGGLVGLSSSSSGGPALAILSGCYYSGRIRAEFASEAGSLIGYNSSISIVSNCFWNSQISGIASGYGGNAGTFAATGLTTFQMTYPDNFAGWNFETIWEIQDGKTCPALVNVSDNAPFAFSESLSEHVSHFPFSALLSNDYDYETLQNSLVLKVESLPAGHFDAHSIYFPASAHMGDSLTFTYQVGEFRPEHDDTLWGNTATGKLIYFNRAPEISDISSKVTDEDVPFHISVADISATDPDNDPVSLVIFHGNHYSVSGNTITPTPDYNGPLAIGIAASDGSYKSDTAYMYIMVTPVNDAPALTAVYNKIITEDTSLPLSLADITVSDAEGDPLGMILGEGDNYSLAGLTIIPLPDYNGMLSVPISISDGIDTSAIMYLKITVSPVNDPPAIISAAITSASKDVEYTYQVLVSDPDDTAFTYSLSWRPVGMTISNGGTIRWTPAEGIDSSGEVQLTVTDGSLEDTEIFTIRVTNVNNAPVARDTMITSEGDAAVIVLTGARDSDGTINSIAIDDDPHHGSARRSGLSVTYTPDPGFAGIDSLSWHAVDNDGLVSNIAKIYITVTALTSIENMTSADLLIYPNPCTDGFYINAGTGSEELTIYDLNGKLVLSQKVKGLTRVNLPNLVNGIYIVIVNGQRFKLITKN